MNNSIFIQLLTLFFLVSCQAGSQRSQKDVTSDSISLKVVQVHDIMSNQNKEDSIRFASYLQLFTDTASAETCLGSKLLGPPNLVSPDEFYLKMKLYRDLYPVSADSICVYYPGVSVQDDPYVYVTLHRMGDSNEEYTDYYDETLLVTYNLKERKMIDSKILGRIDGDNIRCFAIKSNLSPLQLTMRQYVFDAATDYSPTDFRACDVTETEFSIDGRGHIQTKQYQWRDEGNINLSSDFYAPYVYLKSEQEHHGPR